jgi:hypothetical protein
LTYEDSRASSPKKIHEGMIEKSRFYYRVHICIYDFLLIIMQGSYRYPQKDEKGIDGGGKRIGLCLILKAFTSAFAFLSFLFMNGYEFYVWFFAEDEEMKSGIMG